MNNFLISLLNGNLPSVSTVIPARDSQVQHTVEILRVAIVDFDANCDEFDINDVHKSTLEKAWSGNGPGLF